MTVEQLRDAYNAYPFKPFVLHLADGREIRVRHREYLAPSPSGRTLVIYKPDDSFNIVDLLLVTDLEFESGAKKRRNGRK